ncbi:HdeD family acid-resistance protein [Bifidobacterium sp. MA2]|uniref:HdeD family acid-resistance protein n=1 Tax=Bifidobacterium santillanense TaxID=2809028 RepID=A0ABS5UNF3_9BIFI|nr:HdeD family acid-resistance protein [Bifidobacterium santillanense]MBT1172409.1 HdeD family acid-resistance protein [Bifidobacterium santillanense]
MTDFNENGRGDSNGRNPSQGRPEYGQYASGYGAGGAAQGAPRTNGQYGGGPYGQPQAGQDGNPYANPYVNQANNPYAGANPNGQYGQPGWQPVDPFKLIESMLPQRTKNWVRATYAIIGVAAILLGVALLVWPGITLQVAAVLLGVYFVVSGLVRVVTAIVELGLPGGWRVLDILVGVLLAVGGVVVLKNAALSGQTLALLVTMTVGIGWMLEGFMALVESWRMPSSGWAVLYAVVSIVAGFVVLLSPVSSTVWLVIFGGCALVVMGVSAIVRGLKFGRLPKNAR